MVYHEYSMEMFGQYQSLKIKIVDGKNVSITRPRRGGSRFCNKHNFSWTPCIGGRYNVSKNMTKMVKEPCIFCGVFSHMNDYQSISMQQICKIYIIYIYIYVCIFIVCSIYIHNIRMYDKQWRCLM